MVLKENRRLDLYDNGRLVRSYLADMGYRSFNDKLRAGDAAGGVDRDLDQDDAVGGLRHLARGGRRPGRGDRRHAGSRQA